VIDSASHVGHGACGRSDRGLPRTAVGAFSEFCLLKSLNFPWTEVWFRPTDCSSKFGGLLR
jgi:hypothetical protein